MTFYEENYKQYITEVFNSKIINLVIRFIKTSTKIPEHIIQEKQIFKNIINIVKELMMNEIEITLMSKYIDDIGWTFPELHHLVHILFVALFTKEKSNMDIRMFIDHFDKQNVYFKKWYEYWKGEISEECFQNEELFEHFSELNKPFNSYCENNYIDFNCLVDTIITLSQPYGEQKTSGSIKEDKIIDLLKEPPNTMQNQNDKNNSFYPLDSTQFMRFNFTSNLSNIAQPSKSNINIKLNNICRGTVRDTNGIDSKATILEDDVQASLHGTMEGNVNVGNGSNSNSNNNNMNYPQQKVIHVPPGQGTTLLDEDVQPQASQTPIMLPTIQRTFISQMTFPESFNEIYQGIPNLQSCAMSPDLDLLGKNQQQNNLNNNTFKEQQSFNMFQPSQSFNLGLSQGDDALGMYNNNNEYTFSKNSFYLIIYFI